MYSVYIYRERYTHITHIHTYVRPPATPFQSNKIVIFGDDEGVLVNIQLSRAQVYVYVQYMCLCMYSTHVEREIHAYTHIHTFSK